MRKGFDIATYFHWKVVLIKLLGNITKGVAKGLAIVLMFKGEIIANPLMKDLIPKITIGKMYKISLGHAGSP